MLEFFRKYQKFFFIIITSMVVISFCFFGTYSSFVSEKESKPFKQYEKEAFFLFLNGIRGEQSPFSTTELLAGDTLNSFLKEHAHFIAQTHFNDLKEEFEAKRTKLREYTPYQNRHAPIISAEQGWKQFRPTLLQAFVKIKHAAQADLSFFDNLVTLYLEQLKCPPELMARLLDYQIRQMGGEGDLALTPTRLSFGFRTSEEMLGETFCEKLFEFFDTASVEKVSLEEAKQDLAHNLLVFLKKEMGKESMGPEHAEAFLRQHLHNQSIPEAAAFSMWQKVLSVKRYFADVQSSVLVDPLLASQFSEFAGERRQVDHYSLPEVLRFRDLTSLMQYQTYLEQISLDYNENVLDLPKQLLFFQEVAPELVYRKLKLECKKVALEDLEARVSIKETWDYEEKHYEKASLDRLSDEERLKLDTSTRKEIVKAHPEWVSVALEEAKSEEFSLNFPLQGEVSYFVGQDTKKLLALLEKNPLDQKISAFSTDGKQFFTIQILEREPERRIFTFAQAKESGLLLKLVDQKLEAAYPELRKKQTSLFKNSSGEWKKVAEVREELGALFYSDLLKNIEKELKIQGRRIPQKSTPAFFASHRFIKQVAGVKEALDQFSAYQEPTSWPYSLFGMKKENEELKRQKDPQKEPLFALSDGEVSFILSSKGGNLSFMKILEHLPPKLSVGFEEKMVAELSREAGQKAMRSLWKRSNH